MARRFTELDKMTIIYNQIVPPSLQQLFSSLITVTKGYEMFQAYARLNGAALNAREYASQNLTLTLAHLSADWLAHKYAQGMTDRERVLWRAEQVTQIYAGTFNPEYWATVAPARDRTEYAVPETWAQHDLVIEEYRDPLRQASGTNYSYCSQIYATPPPETTGAQPSPGWYGSVVDTVYSDKWLAKRRLSYDLPLAISPADNRPLWATAAITTAAKASSRGNDLWFKSRFRAYLASQFEKNDPALVPAIYIGF